MLEMHLPLLAMSSVAEEMVLHLPSTTMQSLRLKKASHGAILAEHRDASRGGGAAARLRKG